MFQELRSLQEEVSRQRSSLASKLKKQESEISRLRSQLSAASTPSSEVETRLSTLTQTLVLKQQALESLTTERNALRLQLEKIEVITESTEDDARIVNEFISFLSTSTET